MKLNSIVGLTLLAAGSIESFSLINKIKHVFTRAADNSKCLIANNQSYGWAQVSSGKYPPCWIENGGKYDCYDYKSGTQCDNWNGMFDRTKQGNGGNKPPADSCNRGNMGTLCYPAKESCPKCWQENGGKYDCYDKSGGKCPWGGMIEI
ncbi:hypothetical protein K502DRAFT_332634 [Neoconidiobolus thromboides FSU 785]|nr:hypothetical protein K502DRAFT_332634 [Neoconidiobolus thromboides FSU 785]